MHFSATCAVLLCWQSQRVPSSAPEQEIRIALHYLACLDYQLKGDIYESVVLGFLAILGIDTSNTAFLRSAKLHDEALRVH